MHNRQSYEKLGEKNYQDIYEECYDELSTEGKHECDRAVKAMRKILKREKNIKHFGETSAQELLACLMVRGLL